MTAGINNSSGSDRELQGHCIERPISNNLSRKTYKVIENGEITEKKIQKK